MKKVDAMDVNIYNEAGLQLGFLCGYKSRIYFSHLEKVIYFMLIFTQTSYIKMKIRWIFSFICMIHFASVT